MDERSTARLSRWTISVRAGYSALLTLLITAPLLGPGYLLLRDGVSTPRSYPTDTALGLGDAAPRAVPQDAVLAMLSGFLDGGLVVKAIVLLALFAAGYGAAVLVREFLQAPLSAQLVATTVALWNPYVAERLLQGHWSLLTGYAALPWTVLAATRVRDGNRNAWFGLAGCFAVAGLTPTGALLAGVLALVLVGKRAFAATVALLVAASAPWLVATAVSGVGAEPSDPAGIVAFAARAEPGLATIGSVAGLGGIWNVSAVPASRTTPLAALATVLLLVVVALGVRTLARRGTDGRSRIRRSLLIVAIVAIVYPALGATGWGTAALEWLVVQVPGAGLLRDTQKYVALAMPAYALCAAAACRVVAQWFGPRDRAQSDDNDAGPPEDDTPAVHTSPEQHTAPQPNPSGNGAAPGIAIVVVALLILPMLDLAWGAAGELRAVRYPGDWQEIAERITGPGDIAVMPAGMFRSFPYTGRAPVLDPAPRMLPRDVLQTGELPVRGRMVAGEGVRAGAVEDLLLDGGAADELARLGVGWVVLERTTPGAFGESARTLDQLEPVHSTTELALYRVPDVTPRPPAEHRQLIVAAHLLWAALLAAPVLSLAYRYRRLRISGSNSGSNSSAQPRTR